MAAKPLVVFGCVHIGHENADLAMAKRYVDFVKKEGGYALLLADNHECALPHKGHMIFSQNMNPQKQLEYGIKLFAPIAKNIVGACTGNHSARAKKVAGLDMDKIMADKLGYLDRYYPHQGFVSVKVGKNEYRIAFKHGTGVGSNSFGNCLALLKTYPSADICAASHTHECATVSRGFWDIVDGKRVLHKVTLVNTGSLLDYPDYADEAGYSPQPKGFAVVWLDPNEKRVSVDVSGVI